MLTQIAKRDRSCWGIDGLKGRPNSSNSSRKKGGPDAEDERAQQSHDRTKTELQKSQLQLEVDILKPKLAEAQASVAQQALMMAESVRKTSELSSQLEKARQETAMLRQRLAAQVAEVQTLQEAAEASEAMAVALAERTRQEAGRLQALSKAEGGEIEKLRQKLSVEQGLREKAEADATRARAEAAASSSTAAAATAAALAAKEEAAAARETARDEAEASLAASRIELQRESELRQQVIMTGVDAERSQLQKEAAAAASLAVQARTRLG